MANRKTLKGISAAQRRAAESHALAAGRTVTAFAAVSINDAIRQIMQVVDSDTRNYMRGFAQLTGASITRNRERRLRTIHRNVAEDALNSIEQAYLTRFDKGSTSSDYRNMTGKDGRYAGGKLLAALTSPSMYNITRDGVSIINPQFLDKQAKQWYRMNFGAGSRGKNTKQVPARANVTFFGQTTPIDSALNGFKPSPAYMLPPGWWKGQEDGKIYRSNPSRRPFKDEFYLSGGIYLGGRSPIPSKGFAGSRFLDAGVERMVQTMPQQYSKLIVEWFNEYNSTGGGPFGHASVKVTDARIRRMGEHAIREASKANLALQTINEF